MRIRTFYSLFARPVDISTKKEEEESLNDQQSSIEERLQELNASLPSGFKTSKERMDDINRGLNRLGLSLYAQKEPFARFLKDEVPKSEEDQVAEIMEQAKDEVAFEKKFGPSNDTPSAGPTSQDDDDYTDDDDDSEEELTKEDALLDDDVLAIKTIRRKVVKAQVKLAELVALLDEAKSQKIKEDEEEGLDGDASESSIEKPDSATYLQSSKKKLKSAQRDLKKAMAEWNESLL